MKHFPHWLLIWLFTFLPSFSAADTIYRFERLNVDPHDTVNVGYTCVGVRGGDQVCGAPLSWFFTKNGQGFHPDILNPQQPRGERPQQGTMVTSGDGICQYSYNGNSDPYAYCGGGDSSSASSGGSSYHRDPNEPNGGWDLARQAIAHQDRLPGVYQYNRGEAEGRVLTSNLQRFVDLNNRMQQIKDQFSTAQAEYREKVLKVATLGVSEEVIPQLHQKVKDMTTALLRADLTPPPAVSVEAIGQIPVETSYGVRSFRAGMAQTTDPVQRVSQLETLIAASQSSVASDFDRSEMTEMIGQYVDKNGIVNKEVLGENLSGTTRSLSDQLKTSKESRAGKAVRAEINRALGVIAKPVHADSVSEAIGGLGLALGADEALAEGNNAEGKELLSSATTLIDLALGFVPVVGAINDLTQIAHGLLTGYDYTGHRMGYSDYALRGLGVALGIFGAAAVAKIAIPIEQSAVRGASLIRKLRLGETFGALFRGPQKYVTQAVSIVGDLFVPAGHLATDIPQVEHAVASTLEMVAKAEPNLNYEGVQRLSQVLKDANIPRNTRVSFIKSFRPGTIKWETTGERIAYRWHNNDAAAERMGSFFGEKAILNKELAKKAYALPETNKLRYLDEFKIKGERFAGETLTEAGIQGEIQFFVPPTANNEVEFLRNLVSP